MPIEKTIARELQEKLGKEYIVTEGGIIFGYGTFGLFPTVKIGYLLTDKTIATGNTAFATLADKLGYKVKLTV